MTATVSYEWHRSCFSEILDVWLGYVLLTREQCFGFSLFSRAPSMCLVCWLLVVYLSDYLGKKRGSWAAPRILLGPMVLLIASKVF